MADEEMEEFFAQNMDNAHDLLWVDECNRRIVLDNEGRMLLIEADEVMRKYRK